MCYNLVVIMIDGVQWEAVAAAAKRKGAKYQTFRSWINRYGVELNRDTEFRETLIRTADADRYQPGTRGRPRKDKEGEKDGEG